MVVHWKKSLRGQKKFSLQKNHFHKKTIFMIVSVVVQTKNREQLN